MLPQRRQRRSFASKRMPLGFPIDFAALFHALADDDNGTDGADEHHARSHDIVVGANTDSVGDAGRIPPVTLTRVAPSEGASRLGCCAVRSEAMHSRCERQRAQSRYWALRSVHHSPVIAVTWQTPPIDVFPQRLCVVRSG
jgi:hypothetical protein